MELALQQRNVVYPCTVRTVHQHDPQEERVVDPDTGLPFVRTTCARCQRWLSDRPVNG